MEVITQQQKCLEIEKLEAIIESSKMIVLFADGKGNVYNGCGSKSLNFKIEQYKELNWIKQFETTDQSAVFEKWAESLLTSSTVETISTKLRSNTIDTAPIDVVVEAIPVPSSQLCIKEWIITLRDVSNIKLMEKQLAENEVVFHTLIESMPHLVWIANASGEVVFFNKRWEEYTGKTSDQSAKWKWEEFIHPEDLDRLNKEWLMSVQTGENYEVESRILRHNGEYRWFMIRGLPIRDITSGKIIRWIGTNTDINAIKEAEESLHVSNTELETKVRKRTYQLEQANDALIEQMQEKETAESALRKSEERFRILTTISPVGIFRINKKGEIVYYNQQFSDIFEGVPTESFALKHWLDIVCHPEDIKELKGEYEKYFQCGTGQFKAEFRVQTPSRVLWVICQLAKESNGTEIKSIVGVMTNITDRKRLEKERLDAIKQAEEQQRKRAQDAEEYMRKQTEFIDSMSHEIRSPLNAVVGTVDIMYTKLKELRRVIQDSPSSAKALSILEELQSSMESIEQCTEHQIVITNDILSLSKLEANRVELDIIPFNLKDLILSTAKMFYPKLKSKNLQIDFSWPKHEDILLKGDTHRLRQILVNFVSNAIKFTRVGGILIALELEPLNESTVKTIISIKDTGIGMSKKEMAHLFQRFYQANKHISSEYGGSGLGLVISEKLVRLMGGKISVESEVDCGTTFIIEIPFPILSDFEWGTVYAKRKSISRSAGSTPNSCENSPLPRKTILIVEDNPINMKVLETFLHQKGYMVEKACNGKEALAMFYSLKYNFDLIFMDLEMEKMDGFATTLQIRDKERELSLPPVPIVCLSGNVKKECRDRAFSVGMNEYILKPYKKDVIYSVIEKFA